MRWGGGAISEGNRGQFTIVPSPQLLQANETKPGPSVPWSQWDPRKLVYKLLSPPSLLSFSHASLCPGSSLLLQCPPLPSPSSTLGEPSPFSAQPKPLSYTSQASGPGGCMSPWGPLYQLLAHRPCPHPLQLWFPWGAC